MVTLATEDTQELKISPHVKEIMEREVQYSLSESRKIVLRVEDDKLTISERVLKIMKIEVKESIRRIKKKDTAEQEVSEPETIDTKIDKMIPYQGRDLYEASHDFAYQSTEPIAQYIYDGHGKVENNNQSNNQSHELSYRDIQEIVENDKMKTIVGEHGSGKHISVQKMDHHKNMAKNFCWNWTWNQVLYTLSLN